MISGIGFITENAIRLVYFFLMPHITRLHSYVKDTLDLLKQVDGLYVPPSTLLVTTHVCLRQLMWRLCIWASLTVCWYCTDIFNGAGPVTIGIYWVHSKNVIFHLSTELVYLHGVPLPPDAGHGHEHLLCPGLHQPVPGWVGTRHLLWWYPEYISEPCNLLVPVYG